MAIAQSACARSAHSLHTRTQPYLHLLGIYFTNYLLYSYCMSNPPPLPPTAQVIADVIGRDATLLLAGKVANRNLYIPYSLDEHHWIAKVIGYAKAHALKQEFGGLHMSLATCDHYYTRERNELIKTDYINGISTIALASKYSVTQRRIQHIVSGLKRNTPENGQKQQ